ncbi:MAG: hemolysin family protein [Patescibacteria group bacterium]
MKVALEILLIIFIILLNGYFSLSEIALLSAKKSKLRHWSKQGNTKAQEALLLTRQSSKMLSTIQIGITSIGIFAGVFGGATIAEYVESWLVAFPIVSSYAEGISVALVVIVITYLSLIIGELVPKQIALSHPEKLALQVTKSIRIFMKAAAPLVHVLSVSTAFVLRLLRVKPAIEHVITEEEIRLLIAEGTESGVFEKSEQKMVESVFYMGNRPIKDFMTPRREVVWLDVHDSFSTIKDKIIGSDRSVFPVSEGDLDNNIGVVEIKDITTHLFDNGNENIDLQTLIQPVMQIDSEVPSLVAIERLKRSAIRIALITDKTTNKIAGIITFHDILEAIVGEFKT